MCGIFEADVLPHVLSPHVPLTLHMGLLRYSLFEAKMAIKGKIRPTEEIKCSQLRK